MGVEFKKGNKGGGRPKGVANKKTIENRERVNKILSHLYEENVFDDLKKVGASERLKMFIALMEYSLPKLQRIAHTGGDGGALNVTLNIPNIEVMPDTSEKEMLKKYGLDQD